MIMLQSEWDLSEVPDLHSLSPSSPQEQFCTNIPNKNSPPYKHVTVIKLQE